MIAISLKLNHDLILQELEQYRGQHIRCRDIDPSQETVDLGNLRWDIVPLKIVEGFGSCQEKSVSRSFPHTMRLLPTNAVTAYFSILEPGKNIPIHEGFYQGLVRYHLCLESDGDNFIAFPCEDVDILEDVLPKNANVVETNDIPVSDFQFERRDPIFSKKEIRVSWKKGDDFCFDDTHIHYVKNNSNRARIILLVDVPKNLDGEVDEINNILLDFVS